MRRSAHVFVLPALCGFLLSCAPINIFSPFIDPSRMGNQAKMEAGYNAIASGDYRKAVELFSGVIGAASGRELADAYIGRGSAYLYIASPEIGTVAGDLISGNISVDNPSDIINQVVLNGDFTGFFFSVKLAADDFNRAVAILDSGADPGILLQSYQINMMAATGIAAGVIAAGYNTPPWDAVSLDEEYEAVVDEAGAYPYNISTWDNGSGNGLYEYVCLQPENDTMFAYLEAAFYALTLLLPKPPAGMSSGDIVDMQNNINEWVTLGLDRAALP